MFASIKIAIVLTILAAAGGGYMYVKKLQSDLQTARENVAKMEVAVQISEASIATLKEDAAKNAALNKQLQEDLQKSEKYGDELRATLQKHNLTHLANTKPGLIEKRMQDATNKLWDDLESITAPNRVQQPVDSTGTKNSNSN
jgi:phage-related minor tail protein